VGGGSPEHFKKYIFDRPRVEDSWYSQSDVHCFEEFLDLPPRVAAYLKDLITSRVFRYQNEVVPMRCRLIVGCTNHNPADIAKQDVSVAALLERFPLQVEVVWPHYTMNDFQAMFQSLGGAPRKTRGKAEFQTPDWNTISNIKPLKLKEASVMTLALYLSKAVSLGAIVSPRTAVYCQAVMGAYAAVCGDTEVTNAHLDILRLVTGLRGVHKDVLATLKTELLQAEQSALLDEAEKLVASLSGDPATRAKSMRVTRIRLNKVKWVDGITDRSKDVIHEVSVAESHALQALKKPSATPEAIEVTLDVTDNVS